MSLLVNGVLRGHDHERLLQGIGGIPNGDPAFLHRLEKGCLNFRRRTVDFIGENQIRKNRPLFDGKLACLLAVNQGSNEVCRKKVRGTAGAEIGCGWFWIWC